MSNVLSNTYPWHVQPWQQLWQAKCQNRLAHALLLVGATGLAKRHLAQQFAGAMLCAQPSSAGEMCQACHACHMLKAKSHPDFLLIEPEKVGQSIGVDEIRAMIKLVNETTSQGGYKVIIINPATAMNANAANALLKTLEEPTTKTLIMLLCDQGLRLPATIVSRCQKVMFPKPATEEALTWLRTQVTDETVALPMLLKLADGAPLQALVYLESNLLQLRQELYRALIELSQGKADPLQLAVKWQDIDHLSLVDLLLSWVSDLLRFKLAQEQSHIINADYAADIIRHSDTVSYKNVLAYIEYLQKVRTNLLTAINFNKQLLLEDVFIRWMDYVSG